MYGRKSVGPSMEPLRRKSSHQSLPKLLDISRDTARVAPDLLKEIQERNPSQEILSVTTVRRSVVDQEDLKHTGNQKNGPKLAWLNLYLVPCCT